MKFTSAVYNYLLNSSSSSTNTTSFINFPMSFPENSINNNITTVTVQTIEEFPNSLCFVIQRNKYLNKINGPIDFPFTLRACDLIASKEKREDCKDILYRLVAIIVHLGSSFSFGHYVTYRYEKHNQMWYYISDHQVTPIPISLVKTAEPYLLFYEKTKLS